MIPGKIDLHFQVCIEVLLELFFNDVHHTHVEVYYIGLHSEAILVLVHISSLVFHVLCRHIDQGIEEVRNVPKQVGDLVEILDEDHREA